MSGGPMSFSRPAQGTVGAVGVREGGQDRQATVVQHASVELLDAAEAHLALERVALRGELGVQRRPGGGALAAQLLNGGPEARSEST